MWHRLPGNIRTTNIGAKFSVKAENMTVRVHDMANPVQLFHSNIHVVLVGHFSGQISISHQIILKHVATYIAAHPGRISTVSGKKL